MAAPKLTARTLRDQIKLILSQVDVRHRIYNDPNPTIADVARDLAQAKQRGDFSRGADKLDVVARPGQFEMVNDQVRLLRALYTSLPAPKQRQFVTILMGEIDMRTARVAIHTLLDLGHLKAVERFLHGTMPVPVRMVGWTTIQTALSREAHRYGEEELSLLEGMMKSDRKRFPYRDEREDSGSGAIP